MRSRCLAFFLAFVLASCSDGKTPMAPSTAPQVASPTTASPESATPARGGSDGLAVMSLVSRSSLTWSVGVATRDHNSHDGDDGVFALEDGSYLIDAPNLDDIGIAFRTLEGDVEFVGLGGDSQQISNRTPLDERAFDVRSAVAKISICPNDNDNFGIEQQ